MCQVEEEGHSLSDHTTRVKFSLQELGLSSALLPLCPLVLSLAAFGRKEAEVCVGLFILTGTEAPAWAQALAACVQTKRGEAGVGAVGLLTRPPWGYELGTGRSNTQG